MKKLTLVNVSKGFEKGIMPLGILSIATYLRQVSPDLRIEILDANCQDIYKEYTSTDIVGISAVTQDMKRAVAFAEFVKSKKNTPVLLGGVHISTSNQLPGCFDAGVIGEGEITMRDLIELGDFSVESLKGIKGVCYNVEGATVLTPPQGLIASLDSLPIPDRDFLNMKYYLKRRQIIPYHAGRSLTVLTSRGCPFNCAFCSTRAFWGGYRMFSAERVVEEIELLYCKYGVEIIHIFDDLFIGNFERLQKIHALLVRKKFLGKIKFMCLARSDLLNDATMALLKDINVVVIGIGMESGSEKMLEYLKITTTTIEKNRHAIGLAEKYGIPVMGSFMAGCPRETEQDLMKTLNFIKEYRYSPYLSPLTYIATPFPKTKFWEYALSKNINLSDPDCFLMDIPRRVYGLRNVPLLTDIPVERFHKTLRLLSKETAFNPVRRALFLRRNIIDLLKAYILAIVFVEKDIVRGIREVNRMRKNFRMYRKDV